MATARSITRRYALSAATAFPALAALPAIAAPATTNKYDWPPFIKTMEWMHPNGRAVALHALAAGMRLEDLNMIVLYGLSKEPKGVRDDLPLLMFKVPHSPYVRSFSPLGED